MWGSQWYKRKALTQNYNFHNLQFSSETAPELTSVAFCLSFCLNLSASPWALESKQNFSSALFSSLCVIAQDNTKNNIQLFRFYQIERAKYYNSQSPFLYLVPHNFDSLSIFLVKRVRFYAVSWQINSFGRRKKPLICIQGNSCRNSLKITSIFFNFCNERKNSPRGRHLGFAESPQASTTLFLGEPVVPRFVVSQSRGLYGVPRVLIANVQA